MRYELTDHEWSAIKPMLPNKPRGVARVNDRRCKREQDRTSSLYIARCERSLEEAQSQAALGGNFAKAKM